MNSLRGSLYPAMLNDIRQFLYQQADFEELQAQQSSSNQPHAGQSGQLEALSQQLLDDKNAEIDELRRRVEVLRGEAGNESEAESEMVRV